jgi:DNA-binding NtrC family response regulator/ligand-binding sensor domain-containing protein
MARGHWESYDATYGINGTVYAIQEDKDGNLWFATSHCGVTRYDGESFTRFTVKDGLSHNTVRAILRDRDGILWFGTEHGVTRYSSDKFLDLTDQTGLPGYELRTIWQDSLGCYWFGTWGNGVWRYDGKKVQWFTTKDGLAGDEVNAITGDSSDRLWFGTTRGVSMYDGECFHSFLTGSSITAILEDRQGSLWFGTASGVIRYNTGNPTQFITIHELAGRHVSSILEDVEGYIWFGTYSGASRYDGVKYQHFTTRDGLASNSITCVSEDSEGGLWFGSHSCMVSRYDKSFEELTSLEVRDVMMKDANGNLWFSVHDGRICRYDGKQFAIYTGEDGLRYTQVNSILQDQRGNLWLGSYDGLMIYDGSIFRNFSREEPLGRYTIRSLALDSKGNVWLGTDGGGACRYDGKDCIRFTTREGLAHDVVWSILEDSRGNMWFGTLGGGVTRYDGKSFATFTTRDGLSNDIVRAIHEDSRGNIWFATANGISMYDGKRVTNVDPGLLASRIQCICEDSQGHLWFGTLGGGVYRFDRLAFQVLTQEDGIASNAVYSILEDKPGVMLFATQRGITRYVSPEVENPPPAHITKVVADQIYTDFGKIEIPSSAGRIAIEYHGLSFKTKRMAYIYRMEGVDTQWQFTWKTQCEYRNLPIGEYLFEVKAVNRDMEYSLEPAIAHIKVILDPREQLIANLRHEVAGLRQQLEGKYSFENIVGESHQMQQVFALMEKAIDSDLTVLISGETGTGKELVARAIHYNSIRKDGPFVVQNCAALPENLLESELFGHVRGAFTHAVKDKKGLFEVAHGGTLFLDEIGDMSVELQSRMLRILEDGEIRRVGDTRSVRVNVRVIAATNKDLREEISAGRFREDLYYRLAVFPITLPPLRERPDDIPILVKHFLERYNLMMKRVVAGCSPEAMFLLTDYPWPGNVRELENEIKRAITLVRDNEPITPHILSLRIRSHFSQTHIGDTENASLQSAMEIYERRLISEALRRNEKNVTRTAEKLGISRVTLQKKMIKYLLREE